MVPTKAFALACTFILGACVTVSIGHKFDTAHVSDIRPCVTTESDLLSWFGEPYQRGNADGLPTLHWLYTSNGPSGWNSDALVAVVNRAGKVIHFQFSPMCVPIEVKDVCGVGDASAP